MKRLQYAISSLIRFLPLWLLLIASISFTYDYRNDLIELEKTNLEHCGMLFDNNYPITNGTANVIILDNKTQKPINMRVTDDKIIKGYEICGFNTEIVDTISRNSGKYGVLLLITFILLCISCSIIADIFSKDL